MKILFVHQNMPGQYRELLEWLAAQGGHELVFLTQRENPPKIDGVTPVIYRPHHRPAKDAYALSKVWEEAAGAGSDAGSGFAPGSRASGVSRVPICVPVTSDSSRSRTSGSRRSKRITTRCARSPDLGWRGFSRSGRPAHHRRVRPAGPDHR